jgi:hypothetical protein
MRQIAPASQFDLAEEFSRPGCPVCMLIERQLERYMEAISYESAGDPDLRDELTAAHGFCRDHAPHWLRVALVLATANVYNDVLKHLAPEIAEAKPAGPKLLGRDRPLWEPHRACMLCEYQELAERQLVTTLIVGLSDPAFAATYSASDGVCLVHLRAAFGQRPSAPAFRLLQERAQKTVAALRDDLALVIRHHDYRFRHEPAGAEVGSQERALRWVTGTRSVRKG